MTWIGLLLSSSSICLRRMVLKDLLCRPDDDAEITELTEMLDNDPYLRHLIELQQPDGSWSQENIGSVHKNKVLTTSFALQRFGFLNLDLKHPSVKHGAEYLFSQQQPDGSWPLKVEPNEEQRKEKYSMIPLQTALPLLGLVMCGYATDKRSEKAYSWLLEQKLSDGSWPTGIAAGNYGRVAGYRRLAHSRWGCRSNTTAVLLCLSYHPQLSTGSDAQRTLDLILGRETRESSYVGFNVARIMGFEENRGFLTYYGRFDEAMILELCSRVGANKNDSRVEELVAFITNLQNDYGMWEYKQMPLASHFITFNILRSLNNIDQQNDWITLEPRTPFQAYPKRQRRY